MKPIKYLLLLIYLISFSWGAQALKITSTSQLLNGTNASGVVGDYLLANDSVSFIISDIPNTLSWGNTGGQLVDACLSGGLDDFDLFYLYLNKTFPRQGNYDTIEIISSGSASDSAHIRVKGVDSHNASITIYTNYILHNNTHQLTVISSFKNNSTSTVADYGIGDAFAWGGLPFVPGAADSVDWLASRTSNTVYGYTYPSRFASINGSYWSDATLHEVTLAPGEQALMERYFMVGSSLQDIYNSYMNSNNITPGSVSGHITANGNPTENILVLFIKDSESGSTFETKTDANGYYSADIEPGNWICQSSYLGQNQVENIQVSQSNETIQNFTYGNIAPAEIGNDTITVIQSPLVNIPQLALPGDTFKVEIMLPVSEFATKLSLMINEHEYDLNYSELSPASTLGLRTIEAILPDNMIFGLYDLKMTFTGNDSLDISEQSVCVIPKYDSDFTFIQVTDTHLPSHYFWGDEGLEDDSTEMLDFLEVINDINIINPDFVLHTGDFINDGEIEELGIPSISRAKSLLHKLEVPLFLVPGNHDLGGWDAAPAPDGTARRTWWKYFGWKYLNSTDPTATTTQNYSFDYGSTHFIGLESYVNYDQWRYSLYGTESFISSQISWLENDLIENSDAALKIMFYHKDFKNELNLSALGVDATFWGHVHSNNEDATHPYNISTGACCDGGRWYRIVKVSNNNIVFNQAVQAGNSGQTLTMNKINDSTIRFTNNHPFALNDCMVKFEIEDGMQFTSLTNATLFQIDTLVAPNIVYALTILPSNGTVDVSIQTDSIETGLEEILPSDPFLMNVYPNPFNPNLAIRYQLSDNCNINIGVYDIQGKLVETLYQSHIDAGTHEIIWHAGDKPSGLYFIKADIKNASGSFQSVRKCLLMK